METEDWEIEWVIYEGSNTDLQKAPQTTPSHWQLKEYQDNSFYLSS